MAKTNDDEFLVRKFNRGDDSAFDAIVRQYADDVAALANRLLAWPGDVEDITQDIFLAAFLGLKKFRCQCSLKTWLFTITINKCRTHRYKRMLRIRLLRQIPGKKARTPPRAADIPVMDSETFDRVRRSVADLPAKFREPVVLSYLQQLPTAEVAAILSISENALQVRLNRARKHLKRDLAELMEK